MYITDRAIKTTVTLSLPGEINDGIAKDKDKVTMILLIIGSSLIVCVITICIGLYCQCRKENKKNRICEANITETNLNRISSVSMSKIKELSNGTDRISDDEEIHNSVMSSSQFDTKGCDNENIQNDEFVVKNESDDDNNDKITPSGDNITNEGERNNEIISTIINGENDEEIIVQTAQ